MSAALNKVEFLSRSPHRVTILDSVMEVPHDRSELREATGASSSTLGRVLSELTDRGWVAHVNHRYEATPMGRVVGEEFIRLLDTMETVERITEAVTWLPTEEMDFEVSALQDAAVTTPTQSNPFVPVLRMAKRLADAEHVSMLAYAAIPQTLAAIREGVVDGTQTFEGVITPDLLDAVAADREMATHAKEILETDSVAAFCHEGAIPYNMAIVDGSLLIGVSDDQRMPRALIEADDERVVAWGESTYETYRREAEPVDIDRIV